MPPLPHQLERIANSDMGLRLDEYPATPIILFGLKGDRIIVGPSKEEFRINQVYRVEEQARNPVKANPVINAQGVTEFELLDGTLYEVHQTFSTMPMGEDRPDYSGIESDTFLKRVEELSRHP